MKIIALLLALLASTANAQADRPYAYAPNAAGGRIVLMSQAAGCKADTMRAYSAALPDQVAMGCWVSHGDTILVTYDNGRVVPYDRKAFTIVTRSARSAQKGNP